MRTWVWVLVLGLLGLNSAQADVAIVDPASLTGYHWVLYVKDAKRPQFLEARFCQEKLGTPNRNCSGNAEDDLIQAFPRFQYWFDSYSLDDAKLKTVKK